MVSRRLHPSKMTGFARRKLRAPFSRLCFRLTTLDFSDNQPPTTSGSFLATCH
jgi:hypothetical protein